jgi:hypothetical protein
MIGINIFKFKYNISNAAIGIKLAIKLIEKKIKIQNIIIFIFYKCQSIVYTNIIVDLQGARPSFNIEQITIIRINEY